MNNPKTPADHLWNALKATIQAASCGSECGCADRALQSAKDLRNAGHLKEYLAGEMSLDGAMRRVVSNTMPDMVSWMISILSVSSFDDPLPFRRSRGAGNIVKDGKVPDGKKPAHASAGH